MNQRDAAGRTAGGDGLDDDALFRELVEGCGKGPVGELKGDVSLRRGCLGGKKSCWLGAKYGVAD